MAARHGGDEMFGMFRRSVLGIPTAELFLYVVAVAVIVVHFSGV